VQREGAGPDAEASHGICIACASVLMQELEVATRNEPG